MIALAIIYGILGMAIFALSLSSDHIIKDPKKITLIGCLLILFWPLFILWALSSLLVDKYFEKD